MVIDDKGAVVRELGTSTGGFAWSEDSQKLYFAAAGDAIDPKLFDRREGWRSATASPTTQAGGGGAPWSASCARPDDAAVRPACTVLHMALSPDQNWLAVMTFDDDDDDDRSQVENNTRLDVFVYSIASRRLYPLATTCSPAMCFTGPDRLAFTEPDLGPEGGSMRTGHLVEVVLDDKSEQLERKPRLEVMPSCTPWIRAIGEPSASGGEMLVICRQATVVPALDPDREPPFNLYRFTPRRRRDLRDRGGRRAAVHPQPRRQAQSSTRKSPAAPTAKKPTATS